jgi:hypothetical protein
MINTSYSSPQSQSSSSRVPSSPPDSDDSNCLFLATYSVIGPIGPRMRTQEFFNTHNFSARHRNFTVSIFVPLSFVSPSGSGHSPHSVSHWVLFGSWFECALHAPHSRGCVGKRIHQFAMTSRSLACPTSCPPPPNFFLSWYHSLVCCIFASHPPCRICLRHLLIPVTHSRRISRLGTLECKLSWNEA